MNDTDEAYDIVMDAIITQKLAPGQKVSENILNEMFGVSRTASRNLMERLTAEQFLISTSPRITQVAPLTLLEIKQNFALRHLISLEAVTLSLAKIDLEKLDEFWREIEALHPIESEEQALEVLKINMKTNIFLGNGSGYPLMQNWHKQLEYTAMRIYWFYMKTNKSLPVSFDRQNIIRQLIEDGETEKVRETLHQSLIDTENKILNGIITSQPFLNQDLRI